MASIVRRREFLAGSAALAGAAIGGGFTCVEVTSAAPIEVPVIEKLSIRVLVELHAQSFLAPGNCQRGDAVRALDDVVSDARRNGLVADNAVYHGVDLTLR